MGKEGCTRSYCGIDNDGRGFNVTLGIAGDPGLRLGNGYRFGAELASANGVAIREVAL
jgi:hypothetical protein